MAIFKPGNGFLTAPDPTVWATNQAAIADMRAAAGGASLMIWPEAGQMGAFVDPLNGDGLIYEKLSELATTTRASRAWHPNWDFVSGSIVGPLIEYANNEPVVGPGGLLVADVVENLDTNPRAEGPAGSSPTFWTDNFGAGVITYTGRGTMNGWPYIEFRLNGVVTSGFIRTSGGDIAAAGPVAQSLGLMLVSGKPPANSEMRWIATGAAAIIQSVQPDHNHRRFGAIFPAAGVGGASARFYPGAGTYDNVVYRLFSPSVTRTVYHPPVVFPPAGSTGASLKASESPSIPTANWYRNDEGTMVVEFTQPVRRPDNPSGGSGLGLVRVYGGSSSRRLLQFDDITGDISANVRANAGSAAQSLGGLAAGKRGIVAMSWNRTQSQGALNGVAAPVFGAGLLPDPAYEMNLGYGAVGGAFHNLQSQSPIHRMRYFPRVMTAVELAAITRPYWG